MKIKIDNVFRNCTIFEIEKIFAMGQKKIIVVGAYKIVEFFEKLIDFLNIAGFFLSSDSMGIQAEYKVTSFLICDNVCSNKDIRVQSYLSIYLDAIIWRRIIYI